MSNMEKGLIKKGRVPWNKGLRGKEYYKHYKCGHPMGMKGKKHSEETKKKISKSHKGMVMSKSIRKKISKTLKGKNTGEKNPFYGKKHTKETRKIISEFNKGRRPVNYIDGRSKFLPPARYGDDWEKIRYVVYLRDWFMCQHCGIIGKSLDVHHKIPFLVSHDNSIKNLITLCRKCHMTEEQKLEKNLIKIKITRR